MVIAEAQPRDTTIIAFSDEHEFSLLLKTGELQPAESVCVSILKKVGVA
jgi:hypothetical protein